MLFCLGEGKYESKGDGYQKNNCIFNVQVTKDEWNKAKISLPTIKISHTYWVDKKDMTKTEKDSYPIYKEIGGYLKQISYEDAWANWWKDAKRSERQAILDLPHFNAEIFKGITGIDIDQPIKNPTEITIDGATYVLKDEK